MLLVTESVAVGECTVRVLYDVAANHEEIDWWLSADVSVVHEIAVLAGVLHDVHAPVSLLDRKSVV